MEDSIDNAVSTSSELGLSDVARRSIISGAKWGKFLAIVGFVFTGLLILAALFIIGAGAYFGGFGAPMGGVGVLYLIMSVIYFFPCFFLLKYANNVSNGLKNGSEKDVDQGFKNLEFMFKFVGIMTIVGLAIYIIVLLFVILAAATSSF